MKRERFFLIFKTFEFKIKLKGEDDDLWSKDKGITGDTR